MEKDIVTVTLRDRQEPYPWEEQAQPDPAQKVLRQLCEQIRTVLAEPNRKIEPGHTLREVLNDSLEMVELCMAVEDTMGVRFDSKEMERVFSGHSTVQHVADKIMEKM